MRSESIESGFAPENARALQIDGDFDVSMNDWTLGGKVLRASGRESDYVNLREVDDVNVHETDHENGDAIEIGSDANE
jgi:hypothetical protein